MTELLFAQIPRRQYDKIAFSPILSDQLTLLDGLDWYSKFYPKTHRLITTEKEFDSLLHDSKEQAMVSINLATLSQDFAKFDVLHKFILLQMCFEWRAVQLYHTLAKQCPKDSVIFYLVW
jgi:hypothetical protein